MYAYRKALLAWVISLFAAFACLTASAAATDAEQAAKAMRDIWDKPDAPLVVEPVVIEGDYALAGWVQLERGGRALLRYGATTRELVLQPGESFTWDGRH